MVRQQSLPHDRQLLKLLSRTIHYGGKVQLKLKSEPIAKKINVDKIFADLYNVPVAKDVDSLIDNLHLTYQKT